MSLFRDPAAPRPPSFSEQIRRANAGLPDQVRVEFKPRLVGGARNPKPYRVILHGRDVGGSASLEGALFAALRQRIETRRREAWPPLDRSSPHG